MLNSEPPWSITGGEQFHVADSLMFVGGTLDTHIRKAINFANIFAAPHALSLSPWPPLHRMERENGGEVYQPALRFSFLAIHPDS